MHRKSQAHTDRLGGLRERVVHFAVHLPVGTVGELAFASARIIAAASSRTAELGDDLVAEVTVIGPPHGRHRRALVTMSAEQTFVVVTQVILPT